MRRCIIFGAGDACERERLLPIEPEDVVIAADGGYEWTCREGIPIQLMLGDMDSISMPVPTERCLHFPVEKDDTDMGLAVEEGRRLGIREFYLYGGTGGRPDHTMANYQLLVHMARRGEVGYLVDDRMTVTALHEGTMSIRGTKGAVLSIFAVDNRVEGVTLLGVKYTLTGATLQNSFALGVSNAFSDQCAKISVKKGTLLVMGEYLPWDVIHE